MSKLEYLKSYLNEKIMSSDVPRSVELKKRKHREFKEAIIKETSWIDEKVSGKIRIGLRVNAIENGLTAFPPCKECGNEVNGARKDDFNTYCSKKCMVQGSTKERVEFFERNGHPMHDKDTRDIVVTKLKTGEKAKAYRKKRKAKWMEDRESVGKVYRNGGKKDAQGNTYPNQFEWYGGFHPNTLSQSAKNVISWIRNGVKGYSKEEIQRKWEYDLYLMDFKSGVVGIRSCQPHFSDYTIDVLSDKDKLESLYNKNVTAKRCGEELGVSASSVIRHLNKFGIEVCQQHRQSSYEHELSKFLEDNGIPHKTNDRTVLDGMEADIVIEDHNLLIEINGLYWHSDAVLDEFQYYHQNKSILALDKGYNMLHIWEDEWIDDESREKMKNMILGMCADHTKVLPEDPELHINLGRNEDIVYLLKNGFTILETVSPRKWYIKSTKRIASMDDLEDGVSRKGYNVLYDCGGIKLGKME